MRIAFADFSGWDFQAQSVDTMPMGGAQSAACHLARALVREGHEVFLFTRVSTPGRYDGVACLSWAQTDAAALRALKLDVFVCLLVAGNGVALREILGPGPLLILWNQHAPDQPGVQALRDPREAAAYDGFAMVSDWQREQFQQCFGLDRERLAVLRNAIGPAFAQLFAEQESILRQKIQPPVLAYTSTPFRGLDVLLEAFGQIRQAIPGARLRVFSSMSVYQISAAEDEAAHGALYQRCRQMDGVEYVGSLPQPALARELRTASVLAYPNTFAETSCIAVMEAMAAGCVVVTSRLGALPETGAGFARLVAIDRGGDAYLAEFVAKTVEVLRGFDREQEMEAELRRQVAALNQTATWPLRARQWIEWLHALAGQRRPATRVPDSPSIAQALELALGHHRAGRRAEAETLYRQILAAEPRHADALHLLGLLAHQGGDPRAAVELIGQAIALRPDDAGFYSNLSEVLRVQGRVEEAVAAGRQATELRPDYAQAHRNLGNALCAHGQPEAAVAAYQRALELQPGNAAAHDSLGQALGEAGRIEEAIAAYRAALRLQPDLAETHNNLGNAFKAGGRLDEAMAAYRAAIALQPALAVAHNNLGAALEAAGRREEAIVAYCTALGLRPDFAAAHNNLGQALTDQGRLEEAVAACRRALQLDPACAAAHSNLGVALHAQGHLDEATAGYRRALDLEPAFAEAHNNLGTVLLQQNQLDEALAAQRRALELQPDFAAAHLNLGNVLKAQGQLDEAIAAYRRALDFQPESAEALSNWGHALKDQGCIDAALECFRRASALPPADAAVDSNLILAAHYHPGFDRRALAQESARWEERHGAPLRRFISPHENDREPGRRLKVGYVSPDFARHAEAHFILPLLAAHDHAEFEIHCYSSVRRPDEITERLRASADVWRDVPRLGDEELARQIRADRIDLLVDLTMYLAGNRLPLFARKPAPVQVAWLGHPGSTGLAAIDYLLTDAHLDPAGAEWQSSFEGPVRLPDSWCCYDPIDDFPPPGEPPALRRGHVTFGSLNHFGKVHDGVLRRWAAVLSAVDGSRLLLRCPEGSSRRRVADFFQSRGIAAERVEFVPQCPRIEYLRLFQRIDLALDPFPYNGHTTTCEALWMGVPVLTLPGEVAASRMGLSLLSSAGLPEFVAHSETEYVELARSLAGDLPRLAELRRTLRDRLRSSPLMDAPRFARHVEQAYRRIWRVWCEKARCLT